MAGEGVRLKILTNAFEAPDLLIVHSAHAKLRKMLLRAGLELYQSRAAARCGCRMRRSAIGGAGSGVGREDSALHAKVFAINNARLFIDFLDFDRLRHNTERGS